MPPSGTPIEIVARVLGERIYPKPSRHARVNFESSLAAKVAGPGRPAAFRIIDRRPTRFVMDQLCTGRARLSLDEAEQFVTRIPETQGRVSYVVAGACSGCGSWHLRLVERRLQLAS